MPSKKKEKNLLEDVDEDEEESTQVEKIDFEEVIVKDKFVASRVVVDATLTIDDASNEEEPEKEEDASVLKKEKKHKRSKSKDKHKKNHKEE
ncbi:hypothetical protein V6N13_082396 [Hibiscus sabdariffa]